MEEDEGAQSYPCGNARESRTHVAGECDLYKEQRNGSEEMRKIDGCDREEIGTLDSSKETITILGDRWWPQTAKEEGKNICTACNR